MMWSPAEVGVKQEAQGPPPRSFIDRSRTPWQLLDGVYCVNLNRRPERWTFMKSQFASLRMPARRFPSIDGHFVDVKALANVGLVSALALSRFLLPNEKKLFGIDLTPGGLGCALSHMQIWRDIIERSEEGKIPQNGGRFLVVEDDCLFTDGFSEELLAERLSVVPNDWEIVFLGGQDLMKRQADLEVAPGVRRLYKGFRETTSYMISVAGCKACLEVAMPLSWQIDTHLTENEMANPEGLMFTAKPRGYCLFPPLVGQARELFSTDVQKCEHD
eukprot:TRINITY_DN13151_c0_g2_i1.p1 TRINITY_DN13151_c0_g2~~TRINITY_DN13151_c0_g2_i1.p1  ORF type:complete len:274 (-),score=39.01 TRINITY_DN13151_c0_g2_i1:80-901(-)